MWSDLSINHGGTTIAYKTSAGYPCPYLSVGLRRKAFNFAHNLFDPSGRATAQIVAERHIWWGQCRLCQTSKITWHVESGIGEFHTTHCCFTYIHIEGYRYLFAIIGRNTRWPEAIQIQQQMAESCVKAFIRWVSRHGVQQIIMSCRGANFMPSLWNALTDSLVTKVTHNGLQPRSQRLTARCQGVIWRKELPWVLPGLRTSPHVAFDSSPAEILYGQALTLLADIFQHPTSLTSSSDICKALEQIMLAIYTSECTEAPISPS
ncbi:uncharacterized protein [Macrobrachium rosenbergii]|uniref:uncharacterized protein n=1 Tax=Macrobrachium rosenbergii TaxID=79674 RepID=UPI0034D4D716